MKKLILVAVPVVLGIAAFLIYKFSAMNDPPEEAEVVTVTPKLVGSTGRIMQDADIFAGFEEPDEFSHENAGYLQAIADTLDISVNSETADEVVLLLHYYDANKVLEEALADKGFSSDLKNFNSLGIDGDAIQDYLIDYVKSLLGSGELQKEQKTLSVKKLGSKLETNKFILEYCNGFSSDFLKALATSAADEPEADDSKINSSFFIKNCSLGKDYLIYLYDGKGSKCKCRLRVDEVLEGPDKLLELSKTNSSLVFRDCDTVLLVRYRISNLEEHDVCVPNNFVYLDDELHCYLNTGNTIVGVSAEGTVGSKETREFVSALVVPKGAFAVTWRDRYKKSALRFSMAESTGEEENGEDYSN